MAIITLIIFTIFFKTGVLAQANTNGEATIVGTLTQTDCSTYPYTAMYELLCPLPNQGGSQGICDSHCRCIHKAKWGRCEVRPADAPLGTGWGNQWCFCSYEDPPEGLATNPFDSVICPLWHIADPLCSLTQVNDTAGGCSSDCICAHGFKNGYCDKDQYCVCTNEERVDLANTFGSYPLMGTINQILGG